MSTPLNNQQVKEALGNLNGWEFTEGCIKRSFKLKNFKEAVSFIVRLSFEAEKLNHHPQLTNVYNRIDISLTTHDANNKITQKDIDLASAIDKFNWAK